LLAKQHQKAGINYNIRFESVGDRVILTIVLTLALHIGYELFQSDIDTAYFYEYLKETIYIIQPESFDESGRGCILQKCIYDLE
jgi:hypothetical protein